MSSRPYVAAALFAARVLLCAVPAAAQGETVITQAKANAGGVTSGDAPGFPVTLSTPGSYILGSNLSPGKDLDGIVAAAPDISIDLRGFTISGGPAGGTNNARYGIWDKGNRLTVKNGTIGAFEKAGIYAVNQPYLIIQDMRIINGGSWGINAAGGDVARIQNNTISTNINAGIICGRSCHVEGNVVSFNGLGIRTGFATVLGNTITFNADYGIRAGDTSDQVGRDRQQLDHEE